MDQLCEPIIINRKFIKLIETKVLVKYNNTLDELLIKLEQEINEIYLKKDKHNISINGSNRN